MVQVSMTKGQQLLTTEKVFLQITKLYASHSRFYHFKALHMSTTGDVSRRFEMRFMFPLSYCNYKVPFHSEYCDNVG